MDTTMIFLIVALVASCAAFYWLDNLPVYPEYDDGEYVYTKTGQYDDD